MEDKSIREMDAVVETFSLTEDQIEIVRNDDAVVPQRQLPDDDEKLTKRDLDVAFY